MSILFYILTSNVWQSQCLCILVIWYHHYFNFICSNRCVQISYRGFNCMSLMASDATYLFMCTFVAHIFSVMSCSLMSNWLFNLVLSFVSPLYNSRYESFVKYVVHKYFLPVCSLFFHPIKGTFHKPKVSNFDEL